MIINKDISLNNSIINRYEIALYLENNSNFNGNTTLFETSKITGAKNINLASGILILRIDPTKKDSNRKDIKISVIDRLSIDPLTMALELYDHLNKSYKSIISSGEL